MNAHINIVSFYRPHPRLSGWWPKCIMWSLTADQQMQIFWEIQIHIYYVFVFLRIFAYMTNKKTITLIIKYKYSCVCTKLLSNKWIQLSKSSPALNGGAYFSAGLDLDNCIIITKNVCSCQRGKTSKKIMLLKNIQILWIVWRLVLEVFLVGKSAMLAFIY